MGLFVAIFGIIVVAAVALTLTVKNLIYRANPNEVLVFSGRRHAHGNLVTYYRVVKGGRSLRVPFFETVDRIDLSNMNIDVAVRNSYSKGGIPLTIQGVANVKIPGTMPLLHNALERFLGRTREDIRKVARETLEGNLRGVLAGLTPAEVNRDKERFARELAEEAHRDLAAIGLELDTLNIQNVSDEVGYLDAIGRMRSAHIRRDAQLAEASAKADAAEVRFQNLMQGKLAQIAAEIEILRKENERRIADARTRRAALIAEERAQVQAALAQAHAELAMQDARIEQVRLKLSADVVRPAEAERDRQVEVARAQAATIIEQGKATAQVLTDLAASYKAQGSSGRDVLLMQKLVPILRQVSSTIGNLEVSRLTVLGGDAGSEGSVDGASVAKKLLSTNEQVKAATGVDFASVLRQKYGAE